MKKITIINDDLVIEKGDATDYSDLKIVTGSVDVRQGATFTAPVLAEHFKKIGYPINDPNEKFSKGVYINLTEKEKEYLTRLKRIIAAKKLYMRHWHQNDDWKNQTIQYLESNECNTTHCFAGWIQIWEKDELNHLSAEAAGKKAAPGLAFLFDQSDEYVEAIVNTLVP